MLRAIKLHELEGHTETVEFCKFDSTGKWLVTGGMNNQIRVWDVINGFTLKKTIEEVPIEDMLFIEWHPTAPVFLTGGKDFMIWMVNAGNGKVMNTFIGHEGDVNMAQFTLVDGGKQIISCSSDRTVRLWNPTKGEIIQVTKNGTAKVPYHEDEI